MHCIRLSCEPSDAEWRSIVRSIESLGIPPDFYNLDSTSRGDECTRTSVH